MLCVSGESVDAHGICEKSVFDLESHFHTAAFDDLSRGWERMNLLEDQTVICQTEKMCMKQKQDHCCCFVNL